MSHEPITPDPSDQAQRAALVAMATQLGNWDVQLVLQKLSRLVRHGNLAMLTRFKEALQLGSELGTFDLSAWQWQGLALVPATWLQDPDPLLSAFARDWLNAFRGSASIAEVATREVLASLHSETLAGFRLERAQRLVELVLRPGDGAQASDVGQALAPVVERLLEPRKPNASAHSLVEEAALFEHILRLDAQDRPEQLLALANGASLVARAIQSERVLCLEVLDEVYGPTHPARPALCAAACLAMREQILRSDFHASALAAIPIVRGWLDAETADAVLAALATHWVHMPEALKVARALQGCGANLDTMTTVRQYDHDENVTPHIWTGTLLHQAVDRGAPELVRGLLKLDCDPRLKSTRREEVLGTVLEEDCFETSERMEAGMRSEPDLSRRRRHEDVGALLRGWRARRTANDAIAVLLDATPNPPLP